jgi:hypothetical protein
MAQTELQVNAAELENVQEKVPVLFEREATFYSQIEKRPVEKVSARDMRVPLEISPGGLFGHWDPAGGDMGRGEGPDFDKALVSTTHLKHAVEWQTKAQWATDDARKSRINNFRHMMATSMKEFRRGVDSLCMTNGTGVMGTISAVSTVGGKDTYTLAAAGDGFGVRLLRKKHFYSVYDSTLATRKPFTTLGSLNGEGPIEFYDGPNKQVRFNATVAAPAVAGDKLVVSGLSSTPPVSLLGVPYHHNNASAGAWLGMDRALIPEIRANRVAAANSSLALPFPRLAVNRVTDRVGFDGVMSMEAWMHPCQVQAYEELGQLAAIINKEPKEQALNLYFNDNMQMAGVGIRKSMSWDKTRIDFIVKEVWGRAEMHAAGFYDVDGRKVFEIRGASGGVAASQVYYIVASFNLFVNNPAACVYIDQLAVPSGY